MGLNLAAPLTVGDAGSELHMSGILLLQIIIWLISQVFSLNLKLYSLIMRGFKR